MSGQAFEFTPGGVQPLALPAQAPGAVINARDAIESIKAAHVEHVNSAKPPSAKQVTASKPIKRASLVKQIRLRLRDIERELKSLGRLQLEAAELRRLLAAAKQPPAAVADIHKARKSG
jgi:hypothetical protein